MDPLKPGTILAQGTVVLVYTSSVPPTLDGWKEIYHDHGVAGVVGQSSMVQIKTAFSVDVANLYYAAMGEGLKVAIFESPLGDVGFISGATGSSIIDFFKDNPIPGVVLKDKETDPVDEVKKEKVRSFVLTWGPLLVGLASLGVALYFYTKKG